MAWLDSLFNRMVEVGASDLHMTSGRKPVLRIDGEMVTIEECEAITPDQMRQILLEVTPEANAAQFESEHDTDFAYEIEDLARFRANLFEDNRGPGGVFRVIPAEILTVEQLGLPASVMDLCSLSKGLVLVTGPTGSGKSTTLAGMIDHINASRSEHIITIEDPIEFVHSDRSCLVNQREVGGHTESFKRALRAALREDPDIILVGELRDLETIEIALETAETGHLVFGTLHTTTAASTVDRIIDQFPADRQAQIRTMLSGSLKGVVAQTLCKKVGGGRCAALEILLVNSGVASLIREGKTHQITSQMQMGGKAGMRLMNDSLAELVQSGKVSPDEALHRSVDRHGLTNLLNEGSSVTPAASSPPKKGGAPDAPLPHSVDKRPQGDSFEQFKRMQKGSN
ncbi:MAG TPA: type IV pilus twitching motility protein PilT [Planctomycetes bacterium]|nr:type IV pilus twitching motility protein PilT [Planctomycetota bacterium]HIK60128.1 type IV pilus twitching motility protein PilT [Planctomycetota bacterium]